MRRCLPSWEDWLCGAAIVVMVNVFGLDWPIWAFAVIGGAAGFITGVVRRFIADRETSTEGGKL